MSSHSPVFQRTSSLPALAAIATLTYRLVSYWLPLPVGALAYMGYRRRYGRRGETPPEVASSSG